MDVGKHFVLIVSPLGKAGKECVHTVVVGVVDMGTVLVNQNPRLIVVIVGVACDMVAPL